MLNLKFIIQNLKFAGKESLEIIGIVFVLMILIEILVIKYKSYLLKLAETNRFLSYIISSFFGIFPSCTTTFAMDSLYMSGYLSFGGLVAALIASIDESGYTLFSLTAEGKISVLIAVVFIITLFILGIIGGKLADLFAKIFKWKFKVKCDIIKHEHNEFHLKHFIKFHIIKHILKKHIWRIFIWIFLALFFIGLFPNVFSPSIFKSSNLQILELLLAIIIGLIPTTSPNIIFIIMFGNGLIPFSVLLTNSIVQDGHGLLPILGYSFKDAVKIKLYKASFALIIGLIIFLFGY